MKAIKVPPQCHHEKVDFMNLQYYLMDVVPVDFVYSNVKMNYVEIVKVNQFDIMKNMVEIVKIIFEFFCKELRFLKKLKSINLDSSSWSISKCLIGSI